jgi:uncharacterized protein
MAEGQIKTGSRNRRLVWLMEKEDYARWWRDRSYRHSFNKCASVYGCQGFDLDFAGLFWGRDLAVRVQGTRVVFELCDPNDVTDDIGVAYGRKLVRLVADARRDIRLRDLVVERLKNRYRILLSRARIGIFIHCEDPETQRALEAVLQ